MLFFFKKFVSRLFFPVPLVLELLLLGLILQRFAKWRRLGKGCVGAGIGLLIVFGYGIGADAFLRSIERTYPPVQQEQLNELPADTDIVVLGQSLSDEPRLPANSRINEVFLARLIEAVRVHRMLPDARICASVAGDLPAAEKRQFLDDFADILAVEREVFVLLDGARDTADETELALETVRGSHLVLVSSATHLKRAMRMFVDTDVEAIPAPCGYRKLESSGSWSPANLFPSADDVADAQTAIYELLGNAWVGLRDGETEGL